ncbi:zinc finger protein [Macleaya cordata]|uniref:Zinc finger protein n=1 Tax=Macleaya cordata TaxID=56857 RepID=A0A200QAA8_MACCD|nr:zinc finger protein [Macleaya cordata]
MCKFSGSPYLFRRRNFAAEWEDEALVPTANGWLDGLQRLLCNYIVRAADIHHYAVQNFYGRSWVVNLENKECECVQWQMRGFPCVHAVACLAEKRPNWLE